MINPRNNGRYTKLGRKVDFWNRYRFQGRLKLKIFKTRSLALIIKKYTSIINLSPVLINKIRIPLWFNAYSSTEVGTDYIFSFRKKRVRDVDCSSSGLSRTSSRLFDNNVPTNQLALVKRTFRNKSFIPCDPLGSSNSTIKAECNLTSLEVIPKILNLLKLLPCALSYSFISLFFASSLLNSHKNSSIIFIQ